MTLSEYLNDWLELFVENRLAYHTYICYRQAIRDIPAHLLCQDLSALDGMAIQRALNQKARKYPRAAQLMYATLSVALKQAVRLHYIQFSPLDGCMMPKHEPKRAQVFTPNQLRRYLAQAFHETAYPILLLMATLGLRRSEALGLRITDIDFTKRQITIQRQRLLGPTGYTEAPLKSAASYRVLPLAPGIADALNAWWREQQVRPIAGAWLCDISPSALQRAHIRAIQAAGLPRITMHGLRHTCATIMAAEGVPMKVLQTILGHSTYQLTADLYAAHIEPRAFDDAMIAVSRFACDMREFGT